MESIGFVTFLKRLQIGDAVFHSQRCKRVSRRNSFTVAYTKGQGTSYEQIQVFFLPKEDPRMTCGAIIAPMSKSNELICESHLVLGRIVDHIVPLHQVKKNRFHIVSFEDVINVCMYMKFSDSEVGYAAHFPKKGTLLILNNFNMTVLSITIKIIIIIVLIYFLSVKAFYQAYICWSLVTCHSQFPTVKGFFF